MRIIKHTVETKAAPEQIWKLWEDVENWKTWDREIELSRIDGPFQTGVTGSTKFVGTPVLKTLLRQVVPMELVVQEASVLSAKVVSYQSMRRVGDMTEVTFEVEIEGPLSFVYKCMLESFIKKKIPIEMEEMLKRALVES